MEFFSPSSHPSPLFPFQKRVLSHERDLISLYIYKYTYIFFRGMGTASVWSLERTKKKKKSSFLYSQFEISRVIMSFLLIMIALFQN